jgi:hypothetical protein
VSQERNFSFNQMRSEDGDLRVWMCILSQFLWSKNVYCFILVPSLFCAVLMLFCSEKFNLRCTRFLCADLISLRDLFPVYAGVGPVLVFLFPLPVLLDMGSFSSPCGVPTQAKFLFLGLREHSSVSQFYSAARKFFWVYRGSQYW